MNTDYSLRINSIKHRYDAHIILKLQENSINVFKFIKKSPKALDVYGNMEFCDAEAVNKILQTSGIKVIVLNQEDNTIARNWIV